ncbi:MAG: tRNA dihydrouridine synthase DusB [Gammaproteobacteria bacterium]|nr:tRNA dihydrouridine synthase DusB [Gammaproteobacteria bacterium]
MIRSIDIGPHRLKNNVFLAPMAGITDQPFRDLCARYGAGYAASEMISSDTLLYATAKTKHRVQRANNNLPHAVQIAGSDPDAIAKAAALNVELGADIIDINMGCPAKKVCSKAAGSALLENPSLVRSIIGSVVSAVDVPVTLKIRTGPSPDQRNGVEIAQIAEQEGIQCLAVHGRTRADRFKGSVEYITIKAIKEAVGIPVVANGDIRNAEDAVKVLAETGADGVMIGRAAQGNPWIFQDIVHSLSGHSKTDGVGVAEIHATVLEHLEGLYRLYGDYTGVRVARKHIAWYCKGLRNATVFRQQANTIDSPQQQLAIVSRFFQQPDSFTEAA